jgi:hypothetical protein
LNKEVGADKSLKKALQKNKMRETLVDLLLRQSSENNKKGVNSMKTLQDLNKVATMLRVNPSRVAIPDPAYSLVVMLIESQRLRKKVRVPVIDNPVVHK